MGVEFEFVFFFFIQQRQRKTGSVGNDAGHCGQSGQPLEDNRLAVALTENKGRLLGQVETAGAFQLGIAASGAQLAGKFLLSGSDLHLCPRKTGHWPF